MEAERAAVEALASDPVAGSTSRKAEADDDLSLCGGAASAGLWETRMIQASKHAGEDKGKLIEFLLEMATGDNEGESEELPSSLIDDCVEEGPALLDLNEDRGQKPSQRNPACETGASAHTMSAGSPTRGGQMSPMRQGLNGEEVLDEDRVVEVDADEAVQHASDDGETELLIAGATARPPRTRSIEDTSDAGAMSSTEATISEAGEEDSEEDWEAEERRNWLEEETERIGTELSDALSKQMSKAISDQVSDALSRQFDDAMDKYLGSYMDGKVEGSEGCSLEDELDYDDEDWLMEQLREEDDYDDDDDDDDDYEQDDPFWEELGARMANPSTSTSGAQGGVHSKNSSAAVASSRIMAQKGLIRLCPLLFPPLCSVYAPLRPQKKVQRSVGLYDEDED